MFRFLTINGRLKSACQQKVQMAVGVVPLPEERIWLLQAAQRYVLGYKHLQIWEVEILEKF